MESLKTEMGQRKRKGRIKRKGKESREAWHDNFLLLILAKGFCFHKTLGFPPAKHWLLSMYSWNGAK